MNCGVRSQLFAALEFPALVQLEREELRMQISRPFALVAV